MCQAFSCIVGREGKVTWKLGVDSHSDLAAMAGYKDDYLGEFAKFEITPDNGNYLYPDNWTLRVDDSPVPSWCGVHEKELALAAHKKWLVQLNRKLVPHNIVKPFLIKPPKKITAQHISLLRNWDSVWDSVGDSVGASVGASVGDSVRASVWASVGDSVRDSVVDSVWASVGASVWASVVDSVWAYTGTFFKISKWKYIKSNRGEYPFQSAVDLWNMGLVPSFDGKNWRLHGGKSAKVLFEISREDLLKNNSALNKRNTEDERM